MNLNGSVVIEVDNDIAYVFDETDKEVESVKVRCEDSNTLKFQRVFKDDTFEECVYDIVDIHLAIFGKVDYLSCDRLFALGAKVKDSSEVSNKVYVTSDFSRVTNREAKVPSVRRGNERGILHIHGNFTSVTVSTVDVQLCGGVNRLTCETLVRDYDASDEGNEADVYYMGCVVDYADTVRYKCGFKPFVDEDGNISEDALIPEYQTENSAGADFYSVGDTLIEPHSTGLVHTGISSTMKGNRVLQISARSSMPKRGLMLANSVGIIDSDYKGEIMFNYYNYTDEPVIIDSGERIGQGVFYKFNTAENANRRRVMRDGGFGSTN